jgi:hypothetical protein
MMFFLHPAGIGVDRDLLQFKSVRPEHVEGLRKGVPASAPDVTLREPQGDRFGIASLKSRETLSARDFR